MFKKVRSSFSKSNSTGTVTKAPTPMSKVATPTSAVSITKQLRQARSLYEEGIQYFEKGNFSESFECLQEAAQIQELSLGKYHQDTIRSYWKLGRAACKCSNVELDKKKNPCNAKKTRIHIVLQAFQRAARMAEGNKFGSSSGTDEEYYDAMLQDMKELYHQGFLLIQQQESVMTISTTGSASDCGQDDSVNSDTFNDDDNAAAAANNAAAVAALAQKVHADPMKHMLKVFELEQRGDGFVKKKNYRKASSIYSQALQLQDALVGEDSLCGADIRCKLALCFMNTNAIPQARRALQMAYTTFVSQVGTDHPATLGAVARMKKLAMTSPSSRSVTSVASSGF